MIYNDDDKYIYFPTTATQHATPHAITRVPTNHLPPVTHALLAGLSELADVKVCACVCVSRFLVFFFFLIFFSFFFSSLFLLHLFLCIFFLFFFTKFLFFIIFVIVIIIIIIIIIVMTSSRPRRVCDRRAHVFKLSILLQHRGKLLMHWLLLMFCCCLYFCCFFCCCFCCCRFCSQF